MADPIYSGIQAIPNIVERYLEGMGSDKPILLSRDELVTGLIQIFESDNRKIIFDKMNYLHHDMIYNVNARMHFLEEKEDVLDITEEEEDELFDLEVKSTYQLHTLILAKWMYEHRFNFGYAPSGNPVIILDNELLTIDYYKILGLEEYASNDEIKKVYRELVKTMGGEQANQQKLERIVEAYECLIDYSKREKYDQYYSFLSMSSKEVDELFKLDKPYFKSTGPSVDEIEDRTNMWKFLAILLIVLVILYLINPYLIDSSY